MLIVLSLLIFFWKCCFLRKSLFSQSFSLKMHFKSIPALIWFFTGEAETDTSMTEKPSMIHFEALLFALLSCYQQTPQIHWDISVGLWSEGDTSTGPSMWSSFEIHQLIMYYINGPVVFYELGGLRSSSMGSIYVTGRFGVLLNFLFTWLFDYLHYFRS